MCNAYRQSIVVSGRWRRRRFRTAVALRRVQLLQLGDERVAKRLPVQRTQVVQQRVRCFVVLFRVMVRLVVVVADHSEPLGRQLHAVSYLLLCRQVQIDVLVVVVQAGRQIGEDDLLHVIAHILDDGRRFHHPLITAQHPFVVIEIEGHLSR